MQTYSAILAAIEALHYEISTESRLVRAGLKEEQHVEPILERYDWLANLETVGFLGRELRAATDEDQRERRARTWFACLATYVYRTLAPLDDRLHTGLARTTVEVNGERVSYYNLQPRLQKEPFFEKREALGRAIDHVHAGFNPIQLEMLQRDLSLVIDQLRFPSYIDYCQKKKRFDYAGFADALRESLRRTEPLYRNHFALWCDEKLRRPFGQLSRCHVAYLMRLDEFDPYFPRERMLPRLMATLRAMGIEFETMPQIRLDLEERARKNPRACCYAARVPGEVHLILKPVGGLTDYDTFLHEAGHALHYGSTDGSWPYEYRKLGRSSALSELYAFTLQNIVMDVPWLCEVMEIEERTARRLRYNILLRDLYLFRRYCAKLLAELEFFKRGNWSDGGLYARTLSEATGFVYGDAGYLFDMDGEFYSADYLRAWIGEAQLSAHFARQFGPRWTSNRSVGRFLLDLWRQGERPSAEQVIAQIGQQPLDVACLETRWGELEAL